MSVQSDSIKHHFGISVVLLSNYLRKFTIRNHDHDLPFDHFFNNPTSPPPHKNGFLKGTQKKTNNTEAILYHNLPFTTFGTNFRAMGSKKKDSKKIFFKQFFCFFISRCRVPMLVAPVVKSPSGRWRTSMPRTALWIRSRKPKIISESSTNKAIGENKPQLDFPLAVKKNKFGNGSCLGGFHLTFNRFLML